ncbi:MAG: hypothetical protein HY718_13740 [Planctomycetes bacterium]|nr:hypothetical protein [Planctomycetota bacterium]
MAQTSIQIDAGTAAALTAQAEARGMTLDDYLRAFVVPAAAAPSNGGLSLAAFERALDELSADALDLPVLPADFSRAEIYGDHN